LGAAGGRSPQTIVCPPLTLTASPVM
jgi:hypothetical protein